MTSTGRWGTGTRSRPRRLRAEEDLTDFVLLGHSYGGTIISRMAEEMPERIRRLVYWNAFVLNDGESIESVSPPHYKQLMDSIAASGAHGPGAVKLPFPVWREAFMERCGSGACREDLRADDAAPVADADRCGRAQVLPRAPDPALVPELHRGYRDAAGGIRLVPAFSCAPRPLPVGADAGRARSVFHQPGAARREDRRSGQRLNARPSSGLSRVIGRTGECATATGTSRRCSNTVQDRVSFAARESES